MLVRRFVPRALMQDRQTNGIINDLGEVVLQLGYFFLNPGFNSTVAGVSNEQVFWHNLIFYHKKKMKLKEIMVADRLTVAVQEALIRGGVYDVRGLGTKVMHSPLYGTSFQWVDVPEVKVKYKRLFNGEFDFTSYLMIKPFSSQLTKLEGQKFLLDELNQACIGVKKGRFKLLEPSLVNGWLKYPLLDINNSVRLDFTSYAKIQSDLKRVTSGIPLMKNFSLLKLEHTLITAKTGMGKSFLAFALSAELGNCIQYYLDPKHSDLSNFGRFLGRSRYADNSSDIDTKLDELVKIMQKRYSIMNKLADENPRKYVGASANQYGFKPVVVFFDEVSAYLASSKKGLKALKKLLMLGRQAQIFIVLILQDPRSTDNLPSTIKDQTSIRIALGKLTGTLAGLVFGSGTEFPKIPRNVGQGYIQVDGGKIQLFEAPAMPSNSDELYELMKQSLKSQKDLDPLQHN